MKIIRNIIRWLRAVFVYTDDGRTNDYVGDYDKETNMED
jgi:hypothetical protein